MKKIILLLFLFAITVNAQVTQEWVVRYKGPTGSWANTPIAIGVDNNGNIYVAGHTLVQGYWDFATVKYNSDGVEQWVRIYDGLANQNDKVHAMVIDDDGNIYVTGTSVGSGSMYEDIVTIKYSSDGQQLWENRYNKTGQHNNLPKAIALDSNGNIYVGGQSGDPNGYDYVTIKYNSLGAQQWVRFYNGPANGADAATALCIDSEDNIYVTGSSTGIGTGLDIATIKYNSSGAEQWIQRYNGSANSSDLARAITTDNNSNIYVTGSSIVTAINTDLITIKYNSNGIQQWVRNYDGPGEGGSIAADQNGNIYVGGKSELSLATVKYDSTGELQWVQRYSNPDGNTRFSKMVIDNQANVYVTGGRSFSALSNYITIKYDTDGNQQWLQTYWGPDNSYDESMAIAIDDQKNIYVTGYSDSNFVTDYATIKYSQDKEKRYPVFIVPGIAGTFAGNNNYILGWLLNRGIHPDSIQVDPLGRVYDDLISTLENVGYVKNKDLFIVDYDWRLPPGPVDNNIDGFIEGLSGISISDNQFNYAVDYLGWSIKKAADQWRADHNEELDSIDVITHSTGGLVARTYIQSDAYGAIYDPGNNYSLPKIRNFVMIGVPNRGASKAWNPLRDNWISDLIYRFVLSKIINLAYQQVKSGKTITGPDYNINLSSIQDSLGNASKDLFINKYVPTIRYLLATFNFIDFGNGLTNVNDDPEIRNTIVLDLNNGFDIDPLNDPNEFLDSAKVSVIYGVGQSTASAVNLRSDFEFNAKQSFTDWTPRNALPGEYWYKDISPDNNGDGTVPTISSAGQFLIDSRAQLFPFSEGDHTGLVTGRPVQSTILNLLEVEFLDSQIKTGTGANIKNVLSVLLDPAELIITDGNGNRLGYSNSTGALTEIENSVWFGNTDGMGYVFGSVTEPINLQITGLGEDYYVMVSIEDSGKYGGVVLEGFLAQGEVINYQITLEPLSVKQLDLSIPENFVLEQNYPNPFNPSTNIQFAISSRQFVSLKVYDVLGNEIATLVNEEKDRGVYSVNFDATLLASGMYLYRIQAGTFVATKKMILIK